MEKLQAYYQIVEDAITKIGVPPAKARTKNAGSWALTKGSIPVWIDIVFVQNENRCYFQVAAPVIEMNPVHRSAMSLELLNTNNQLYGVAFCVNKDKVYIKTIREAKGLDQDEALAMISRVGNYTSQYQKILSEKYPERTPIGFRNAS